MHSTSEKIIKELIDAKILPKDFDKAKTQLIVRHYLCETHQNAVSATVIACNRSKYIEPRFED